MIRTILRGRFGTVLASLFAVCCLLGLGGPQATAAPSSDPPPASLSWTADLHRHGPAEVNIRHQNGVTVSDLAFHPAGDADRRGYALTELAVHETGRPVRTVHAEAKASVPAGAEVAVEVRGRQSGRWTEWRQAVGGTATLPAPASAVQARLVLRAAPGGARPVVTGLRLTATAAPSATQQRAGVQAAAAALTYRVYATREGLVGETTANGHVIRPRDHFVALPSRRALSPNGSGQYSVRVCNPANGRCETAPVWDVGPWNTHDDYWNPSSTRERFRDLPQGTPEAQAAYLNGYNGGRDEFGRRVANPADEQRLGQRHLPVDRWVAELAHGPAGRPG